MKGTILRRYPIGVFEYGKAYSQREDQKQLKTWANFSKNIKRSKLKLQSVPLDAHFNQITLTTTSVSSFSYISSNNLIALDIMRTKQSISTTIVSEKNLTKVSYTLELNFTAKGGTDTNTAIYNYLSTEVLPNLKNKFKTKRYKPQNIIEVTKKAMRSWEEEREWIKGTFIEGMVIEATGGLRRYIISRRLNPNFLNDTLLSIEAQFNDVQRRFLRGEIEYREYRLEFARICQYFIIEALNKAEAKFKKE